MALFVAIQRSTDPEKVQNLLPAHLAFLRQTRDAGNIHETGPFTDGSGGMIIYIAESLQEAQQLAESDPFIKEGAAQVEVHEWYDTKDNL